MEVKQVAALPKQVAVTDVEMSEDALTITALSTQACPNCPLCGKPSARIHSLYWLLSTSVREIDPLGLPSPSAFSWSDGTQPSIEEGNGSRTQEKTRRY